VAGRAGRDSLAAICSYIWCDAEVSPDSDGNRSWIQSTIEGCGDVREWARDTTHCRVQELQFAFDRLDAAAAAVRDSLSAIACDMFATGTANGPETAAATPATPSYGISSRIAIRLESCANWSLPTVVTTGIAEITRSQTARRKAFSLKGSGRLLLDMGSATRALQSGNCAATSTRSAACA
jgi:hypothetical protein